MLAISQLAIAEDEDVDIYDLSLEELLKIKVSGSTNRAEELKTVPSAVTVFTQQEIERIGLDTLDELMNLVPGFQSYRTSFSGLHYPFSSRGRRVGFPSSEVLVLVDGQRLDEPRTSGSSVVVPKFPLSHIEKIEFIRGSGSPVYGSNAMMGTINIITRSNANEIGINLGSFDRREGYILASKDYGETTVDLYGHFNVDDGDSYQLQDTFSSGFISTDDPRQLADLNLKIKWKDTRINFQHNQFKANNFYEVNQISNGFNERNAQLTSISLSQSFDWLSINSSARLSYSNSKFDTARQLTEQGALSTISIPSSEEALFVRATFDNYNEVRVLIHNEWLIDRKTDFQFGLELRRIKAPTGIFSNNFDLGDISEQNLPVRFYGRLLPTTPVQKSSRRGITGVYAQYQREIFEKTFLTLGIRHDHFTNIESQVSPRFALVKEIFDNQSFKLLYSEAFRAPAENELNLLSTSIILGNQNLKPETVESWELIWMGEWKNIRVSIGYFENFFKNSIVQIETDRLQYENVSQSPTKGFEFELTHELNKQWLVRTTYAHFKENSNLSFREANNLASVMINYQQERINVNLAAFYHDERKIGPSISNIENLTLDDYWYLSAKATYHPDSDWQVFIQFKNMLDDKYVTPPASEVLNEGITNRGRELLVGFVLRF